MQTHTCFYVYNGESGHYKSEMAAINGRCGRGAASARNFGGSLHRFLLQFVVGFAWQCIHMQKTPGNSLIFLDMLSSPLSEVQAVHSFPNAIKIALGMFELMQKNTRFPFNVEIG